MCDEDEHQDLEEQIIELYSFIRKIHDRLDIHEWYMDMPQSSEVRCQCGERRVASEVIHANQS